MNGPIPFKHEIDIKRLSNSLQSIDPKKIKKAMPAEEYKKIKTATTPSKNFWMNSAFGRTLSGRNKAGRVVRNIGVGALSVAGAWLGIDAAGIVETAQNTGQAVEVLNIIERICWIIAGIVGTLAGGSDYIEVKGEKYDEREIMEGKVPMARKLKQKIKK